MRRAAIIMLASLTVGCAASQPEVLPTSYVDSTVSTGDAQSVATAMASVVSRRLPGPVQLIPAGGADPVGPALTSALRAQGTTVVAPGTASTHRLSYRVASLDGGLLMRLQMDRDLAAQQFSRVRGGALRPLGPVAVVEAAQ